MKIRRVWQIAWKDIREMVRDGRLKWAGAVALVLFGVALAAARADHVASERRRVDGTRRVRAQWDAQGEKHPHAGAHFGFWVFKPELSVALLDPGMKAFHGTALWLETHRRNAFQFRPAQDGTAAVRFGALTPALVLQLFVPLVLILIAYAAFSGERDAGTFRQLIMAGASPSEISFGKGIAAAACAATLLAPSLIAAAFAILTVPGDGSAQTGLRLAAMAGTYALYGLIVIAISLAVSARTATASSSLSLLVALWAVTSILMPRAAAALASAAVPLPAAPAFYSEIESQVKNNNGETLGDWLSRLEKETLEKYRVKTVKDLPVGFSGIMLRDGDARADRIYDEHFERLAEAHRRQLLIRDLMAVASPVIAVRAVSEALAGSDHFHFGHFERAADRYRREFVELTNAAAERAGRGDGWDVKVGREFWTSVPDFSYTPPTFKDVLHAATRSLGLLFAWSAAAVALAGLSSRRLRP